MALSNKHGNSIQLLTHSLQWMVYALAGVVVIPVVVGISLGLDSGQIAAFIQRTFFFIGVFSFIQVKWGHRTPILEGPGGMWYSLFIILAVFYPQMGMSLEALRSNLVAGLLLAGLFYIIMALTGIYNRLRPLFTPLVNGTFLILMPLSLSATVIRGIIDPNGGGFVGLAAAFVTITVIIVVSLKARGFLQSVSILCGIIAGWVVAALLGIDSSIEPPGGLVALPELFPWGTPTLDFGIVLSSFVTAIIILSNHFASIYNMHRLLGGEAANRDYNRGLLVTGLANVSAALWGTIGYIPFASAIGFVRLTGMTRKLPFVIFSLTFILISIFPVVGGFFASIPSQVGYTVLLVVMCQIMGMGFQEYSRLEMGSKEVLTCGLSLLVGTGIMFLPYDAFAGLEPTLRIILGNGLIMGLLTCIFLERILR